ncbi:unnamed protein product, partial [Prorocentrum cordatum]
GGAEDSSNKAHILFGSITEWGPQAANFFRAVGYQCRIIAIAETRMGVEGPSELRGKLAMDGWKPAATPALPTHKSDKCTGGGEWILARRRAAATTLEGYRGHYLKTNKRQPFAGFAPAFLRTKGGSVVVVAAYIRPGLRDKGANRDIRMSISTFVDRLAGPSIILGDWNYEPPWWTDKPRLTCWNGTVVTDPSCTAARDKGKGSACDDAIVRSDIATHIAAQAAFDAPWKTHCGIQVTIQAAEPWSDKAIEALRTRAGRLQFDALQVTNYTAAGGDAPLVFPSTDWDMAVGIVDACPKFEGHPAGAKEGWCHIFHAYAPRTAKHANAAYAHWVAAMEIAFLETHNAPSEETGYKTARQIMKATPGRTYLKDPEAGWWQHFSTLLIRYTGQLRKGTQAKLNQLDSNDSHQDHSGSQVDPMEVDERMRQAASLDFCDEGGLHHFCAATERWANSAMARAAGRARKRYLDGAKRAWKEPPGKLHRIAVGPSPPKFEAKLNGVTVGDPYTVMNRAADVWRQIWTTSSARDEKQIIQAYLE